VSGPTPTETRRWAGIGEALRRLALTIVGAALGVGALGAVIALLAGNDVARGITDAYYLVGALLFLVGTFPTGGFSLMRGTLTRRRPTGSRQEPTILILGLALIAIGVLVDVTRLS